MPSPSLNLCHVVSEAWVLGSQASRRGLAWLGDPPSRARLLRASLVSILSTSWLIWLSVISSGLLGLDLTPESATAWPSTVVVMVAPSIQGGMVGARLSFLFAMALSLLIAILRFPKASSLSGLAPSPPSPPMAAFLARAAARFARVVSSWWGLSWGGVCLTGQRPGWAMGHQ